MKVYFEDIYEHIGYLFYAVASERMKLNTESLDKLMRLVDQQWYPAGNGTTLEAHLAGELHSGCRKAMNSIMSPEQAFDHFQQYYEVHALPFGQPLRSKILATVKTLAAEFFGNGTKSHFVARLEGMFEMKPIVSSH